MKCLNCGKEISNNYAVCPGCGAPKSVAGSAVNEQMPKMNFCIMCGKSIPEGSDKCFECASRSSIMTTGRPKSKNNISLIVVVITVVMIMFFSILVLMISLNNGFNISPHSDNHTESVYEEDSNSIEDNETESVEEEVEGTEEDNKDPDEDDGDLTADETDDSEEEKHYIGINPGYPITWEDARTEAANYNESDRKGYLACIGSKDEFDKITAAAEDVGLDRFWIGTKRKEDKDWYSDLDCEDGSSSIGYTPWLVTEEGAEPSYIDKNLKKETGEEKDEYYLMAIKPDGDDNWYINDTANNVDYYTSITNVGYVIELER